MRGIARLVAAITVLAACSGGDDAPATGVTTVPVTTPADDATVPAETEPVDVDDAGAVSAEVSLSVEVDDLVAGELGGLVDDSGDPFEQFASCSGIRAHFGTYVVLVSQSDGPVGSVSVATGESVTAPGIHDATVRVEPPPTGPETFASVAGAGTMTIDDGFRTGSFSAFDAEGRMISGEFECRGGADPAPLADDGVGMVEVFALLRSGGAQRLVGLVAPAGDRASCSSGDGRVPSVRVDGDAATGAITSFELTDEPRLSMRVGTTDYVFDDVASDGTDDAGTFSAMAGDVTVDGALRCR